MSKQPSIAPDRTPFPLLGTPLSDFLFRSTSLVALAASLTLSSACSTLAPPDSIAPGLAVQTSGFSQAQFSEILSRHVDGQGKVNYEALRIDPLPIDAYYARLAEVSPDRNPEIFPTRDEALAYWINAYNASVIALVVAHYPITSVKEVRSSALFFLPKLAGFFVLEHVVLGGSTMNLKTLEDRIIRDRFKEPRIHFALNCASLSDPRLRRRAFEAGEARVGGHDPVRDGCRAGPRVAGREERGRGRAPTITVVCRRGLRMYITSATGRC